MKENEIKYLIKQAMPNSYVKIKHLHDDNYSCYVESSAFEGKSLVQQHQIVYNALGKSLDKDIHAFSIQTAIPK
ncbi:BolA/IbaG family iron-sulfur metabolism protein [Candidatus Endolissoclinum faulkneri]|nr:BolA/IbaG family iron-sulfur metabolism protein [Candidatus Endolissoclinum faulkneri]